MSTAPETAADASAVPDAAATGGHLGRLLNDKAFVGMTATQFLGAFNDNLFKQLVLLICLDIVRGGGSDYQGVANAIFAGPFVLFSSVAGWLSDRTSKRSLVVFCKFAEIGIMLAGMAAFFIAGLRPQEQLYYLFAVLALMAVHSTFFGPAKYGILPELFRDRDLPAANGLIQMTTFLAIIFGTALAGAGKDLMGRDRLWMVSATCVGIAVLGTVTSLVIRKTPIAQPGLPLKPSSFLVDPGVWQALRRDHVLPAALLVSSLFWMIGGLVPPAVNAFGKLQLGLSDTRTSLMTACIGFGIAGGCVLAARLSRGRVRFGLVRFGAWGIIACFALAVLIGWFGKAEIPAAVAAAAEKDPLADNAFAAANPAQWPAYPVMIALGVFSGLFAVPIQIVLQSRPPRELKGRMIGAMNLANWIGIVASAGLYAALAAIFGDGRQYSLIFGAGALIMLPVALLYRPKDEVL